MKRTRHPLRAVVREEEPTCAERTLAGVSPSICFIAASPDRAQVCGGLASCFEASISKPELCTSDQDKWVSDVQNRFSESAVLQSG